MTKITDQAELARLQNERAEKAAALQTYHAEHEKTWSAEDEVAWSELNKAYDAVHARLDAHQKAYDAEVAAQQAAISRSERLASVANHGTRFSASAASLIQNGGGSRFGQSSLNEGTLTTGPLAGMTRGQIGELAFVSWMTGGSRNDRAHAACSYLGFNPNAQEIDCQLLGTGELIPLRNKVLHCHGDYEQVYNLMSTSVGADGGFAISTTFVNRLEVAMIANSGMMQVSQIIRTATGEEMRWPTVDDTGNSGEQLDESTEVDEADPALGQQTWNAYKFSSKMIKVPYELLEDNYVNLEGLIPDMLGQRIGRILNNKATVGSGTGTLKGITVAAPQGKQTASPTAITLDEVIDLEHSVDIIHRSRTASKYMFNDTTLALLRKLKDGNDRPLWQSGANTGAPDTLNTYQYVINTDMANPTAGNTSMLFGILSQYKLRIVNQLRFRRLNERYAEKDQVAFIAFVRADGDLLNAGDNPVKKMVQAP